MAQDTNRACNSESTDGFFTQVAEISEVPFQDTSTDCAICLSPLDGYDDDEDGDGGSNSNDHGSNPKAATITLSCGHRWHLSCVEEQLRRALPDRSRRLLFSGCRCAKCGAFCDHELLQEITRRTDELRSRVDALVRERLASDLPPEEWARADDVRRAELVEGGRRRYAFYLCGSCDGPYFGGTVACADDVDAWDAGGRGAPLSVVLSRPAGRVSRPGRPPRPPRVEVPVLLPSGHARLLWVRALLRLLPRSKQCARPGEKRTKKSAWEECGSNRNVFGGNSGGNTLSRWGCVLISQAGGSFHPLERSIERV